MAVDTATPGQPVRTDPPQRSKRTTYTLRIAGLLIALGVLALLFLLSIAVGAKPIPLGTVIDALFNYDGSNDHIVVRDLRIPRTLVGIAVGIALGLAGALMQALTRNPLADPGILGVNAGAAFAIVLAMGLFGLTTPIGFVWFAFVGAAIASIAVYLLGSRGRGGATPVRLALAGTAIAAALGALTSAITMLNPEIFDQFRFWVVGALTRADLSELVQVLPFLTVGVVIALGLSGALNAVALGDDTGRALGAHLGRTRILGALSITLLCGGAVALAGPIGFVGLTVPHVARAITGPDQRWVLSYSVLLAPILLLASDVLGRVLVRPGELEVGIVTAFVGAPVFIALVRRRRIAQL